MIYHFFRSQILPISLEKAWDFFSNPRNLPLITPPYLKFVITSKFLPETIYAGQIITYKVRPVFNIPLNWMTEITHVSKPHLFIDEQRDGPYRFWHHQHHFKTVSEGVEITDLVHYQIPFGYLGRILNQMKVKSDIETIFNYRTIKLRQIFTHL